MESKKPQKPQPTIFAIMSTKYHLSQDLFLKTIKSTVMRPGSSGKEATMEEVAAFLMVAQKYNLDPFTNEIYAFPSKKGGIVPIVGIDGFISIMNRDPNYDGMELEWAEDEVVAEGGGKLCPKWCEVKIHRKNQAKPVVAREYLDEVYVPPRNNYSGPWQTHTKRMLRHKAIIQAARLAFGITGIYDPDEANRIIEAEVVEDKGKKPDVEEPQALSDKTNPEVKPINAGQIKALHSIASHLPKKEEEMHQHIADKYGANSTKDLSYDQAAEAIDELMKKTKSNA